MDNVNDFTIEVINDDPQRILILLSPRDSPMHSKLQSFNMTVFGNCYCFNRF